jgi:hypothetical protein
LPADGRPQRRRPTDEQTSEHTHHTMTDDTDSPATLFFEVQRETIQRTGDLLEQLVETSTEASEELAPHHQRDIAEDAIELARESTHRSIDTLEVFADDGPGDTDELRETVDSAFDSIQESQADAFDAVEERSEELEDEAIEQIGDQVEMLVEVNEEFEAQLTELAESLVEQAEEGGLSEGLEEQIEQLTERLGEQAEGFADLERQFERIDISSPEE